jgi:hypothetical protein
MFTCRGVLKKNYSPYPGPLGPNDLTDEEAERFYLKVRWLSYPSCPKCGKDITLQDLKEKKNCSCGHRNSLLMDTCLTNSRLSLWKTFRIVYHSRVLRVKPTRIAEIEEVPVATVKRILGKFPAIGRKHNDEHLFTLNLVYATMAAWKDYRCEKMEKMKEGKKCTGDSRDSLVGARGGVHTGSQEVVGEQTINAAYL